MQDKIPLLILLSVGAAFTSVWLALLRKRLNMAWYVAIMITSLDKGTQPFVVCDG